MKVVVCVKQVPDTETRVRIAAGGATDLEPDVKNWIVSPYDEFAIEEALRIKEAKGGEVVLVTVGPERAQAALRTGWRWAPTRPSTSRTRRSTRPTRSATARALAAAIRTLGAVDLVLCGQQGVGGDHSQVPGMLAELLDLPQVTVAVEDRDRRRPGHGRARDRGRARDVDDVAAGRDLGAEGPERAALRRASRASWPRRRSRIAVLDAAALGLDAAALAPRLRVRRSSCRRRARRSA